jgi:hypothetical protein
MSTPHPLVLRVVQVKKKTAVNKAPARVQASSKQPPYNFTANAETV